MIFVVYNPAGPEPEDAIAVDSGFRFDLAEAKKVYDQHGAHYRYMHTYWLAEPWWKPSMKEFARFLDFIQYRGGIVTHKTEVEGSDGVAFTYGHRGYWPSRLELYDDQVLDEWAQA